MHGARSHCVRGRTWRLLFLSTGRLEVGGGAAGGCGRHLSGAQRPRRRCVRQIPPWPHTLSALAGGSEESHGTLYRRQGARPVPPLHGPRALRDRRRRGSRPQARLRVLPVHRAFSLVVEKATAGQAPRGGAKAPDQAPAGRIATPTSRGAGSGRHAALALCTAGIGGGPSDTRRCHFARPCSRHDVYALAVAPRNRAYAHGAASANDNRLGCSLVIVLNVHGPMTSMVVGAASAPKEADGQCGSILRRRRARQ